MRLTEMGYIAKNSEGRKPYFAIVTLHWTARNARANLMDGLQATTWKQMRQRGWSIVKVKVTEIPHKRKRRGG